MDLRQIDALLNECAEADDSYLDANKSYGYDCYKEQSDDEDFEDDGGKLAESTDYSGKRMREASQTVDAIYTSFDKCKSQLDKAINAVLDVADSLEDILVDATAVGGKIEEIIPSHIESLISKLTSIAENELQTMKEGGQSSIESLKDLIGSIPYRDLKPETKEEKIAKISMRPNLSNGPQSAALRREPAQQNESAGNASRVLNFESLREADGLGEDPNAGYEDDFRELNAGLAGATGQPYVPPIETAQALNGVDLVNGSGIAAAASNEDLQNMSLGDALKSDGLKYDLVSNDGSDMMSEFAGAQVNESFAELCPKNVTKLRS